MSTLTIRNLDVDLKTRLRVRAAENGRSMEAEVRAILRDALEPEPRLGLGTRIHNMFKDLELDDFEIPDRTDMPRDIDLGG